ncbi:alpha/beta fold hydrolase [Actinopolymorpha pittospori]|uniref:Pimeloyl-ACP methyl ester carboxylesterase n=1 Tax=Actinopolymorpha pittospori TaxID=648752 RepID=A0A927R9Q7_9ACTN|nr:alpha/beta fold hydrolase [Actinopolymorpha pittospori]MBE1604230.1 pimeloyl-ACP methyl ester carboxylesterase [Actinopolymorpha pittospori]
MNLRRLLAGVTAPLAVLGTITTAGAGPAAAGAAPPRDSTITWKSCPEYSDDVVDWMGFRDKAWFRATMTRMDCGTLRVPLDYTKPSGRWITVAVTRLPATDQAHRLGSLAVNPGGPGGSGYLMPIDLIRPEAPTATLNERYDMIGFDPRGVGYSTAINCDDGEKPAAVGAQGLRGVQELPGVQGAQAKGAPPGPITEEDARQMYAQQVQANQQCAQTDPKFIGALTTGNIARDLDRIRIGLGERKLSYLGVSWGSWLGPVYRSLFPGKVGRMWVDSVAPPDPRMDAFEAGRAKATAMDFSRMADWMAPFNDTYGFGTTGAQVQASLVKLQEDLDAHPKQFTDIPMPMDGFVVAIAASQPSVGWPFAAQLLADLRDATGPTAPPTIQEAFEGERTPPPIGTPERDNRVANQAIFCNGDGGARDFDSAWAAYQDGLARYPVTGVLGFPIPTCAGWPLPVDHIRLRHNGGSLQLSGHRYESVSAYEWTGDMQDAVGGEVFTVEDDMHGSALMEPNCATHVVAYLTTGDPGASGCQGVPVPTGPDSTPPGEARLADTQSLRPATLAGR